YRRLSLAIATAMAHAFSSTPGVIGWQIDNEFTIGESHRCYCRFCHEGFQQWLRGRYPSLDALNQAWGTVFWSNTYTDFSQIPVPLPSGAPPNPGRALDYDRYQSAAGSDRADGCLYARLYAQREGWRAVSHHGRAKWKGGATVLLSST